MANNEDNQEHPLIGQHPHIRSFHQEFNQSPSPISVRDDGIIEYHFFNENNGCLDPPGVIPESEKHWVNTYRLWMFNTVVLKSVEDSWLARYRTAYMAVVYFERLLSLHWNFVRGSDWAIKAVGLICLSLAGKIEEEVFPCLPVESQVRELSKMEIFVMDNLEWSVDLDTPLSFKNFFMEKFRTFPIGNGGNVASRTAAFIFTSMKINGTLKFRPSVVAAAAALAAMDPNLTRDAVEEKINGSPVALFGFTATADEVYRCYASINQLDAYQELVFAAPEV